MQEHDTPSVPYGYCHCGCGQKTNIADRTRPRHGHIKGEPMKYLAGHIHKRYDIAPPNPYGLCLCGCGERTSIAKMTYADKGILAGHPNRYIPGHERRLATPYIVDQSTGCWNYTGATDEKGYALTTYNGRAKRVHIINYEEKYGPTPAGLELDHLCRNRLCVNPDHLEPVTHAENMRRSANAKLSWDDVRDIRRLRGIVSGRELAKRYGVKASQISAIQLNKSWIEED